MQRLRRLMGPIQFDMTSNPQERGLRRSSACAASSASRRGTLPTDLVGTLYRMPRQVRGRQRAIRALFDGRPAVTAVWVGHDRAFGRRGWSDARVPRTAARGAAVRGYDTPMARPFYEACSPSEERGQQADHAWDDRVFRAVRERSHDRDNTKTWARWRERSRFGASRVSRAPASRPSGARSTVSVRRGAAHVGRRLRAPRRPTASIVARLSLRGMRSTKTSRHERHAVFLFSPLYLSPLDVLLLRLGR